LSVIGRVAKTAVGTKTGRRVSKKAIKTAVGTRTGRKALKTGVRVAARSGKGVVATRAGRRALKGVGKAKLGGRVLGSREPSKTPYAKYAFFALAGFAVGALIARSGKNGDDSSYTGTTGSHAPDPGSPAGQRGQTWGSGTALGGAVGASQTGAGRDYSDPSSGPLIGEQDRGSTEGVGEKQPEIEQRIRTSIGEDPRTRDMPRVNVEVTGGVAELRGPAPSEEARQAASEIAASIEGVREVRNLIVVG